MNNDNDNDLINNTKNTEIIHNFYFINYIPYILIGGVFVLFFTRFYYACKPRIKTKLDSNNLKSLLVNENDNIDELIDNDCSICLMKLVNDNDKLIRLRCGHYYHNKCLIKSKNFGHDFCPLCRKNIL
jgi:hypothetical protein